MNRSPKQQRKHVFRRNLQAFMKQAKFDKNSLAARLDLDRDGRKWLGRLLKDGLDRTNSKSEAKLQQLVECLGLESRKQLWDANLALTASDDYHIEAVKQILKEGGSPARDLRSKIEWIVNAKDQSNEFCESRLDSMSAEQKQVALARLYEHIRDSPDNSLDDFERLADEFPIEVSDWPSELESFIERFQELHPRHWQRLSEYAQCNGDDLTEVISQKLSEYDPQVVIEWLIKIGGKIQ